MAMTIAKLTAADNPASRGRLCAVGHPARPCDHGRHPGTMRARWPKAETKSTWETVGAFFAYFAVAKDVPAVLRTLGLPRMLPEGTKRTLLLLQPHADTWLLWAFTLVSVLLVLYLLPRRTPQPAEDPDAEKNYEQRAAVLLRRHHLLRAVRSLGLALLRDWLLDLQGVALYGTFLRSANGWPLAADRFEWVDRLHFRAGNTLEYQYARDYAELIIREQPIGTQRFAAEFRRPVRASDLKLLLLASGRFWLWYPAHLVVRCVRRLRRGRPAP